MSSKSYQRSVSVLGHALLGLLAGRPMSGYDLTRQFDESLRHVWSATHGQIYPELARLATDGLITVGTAGARGRKVYTIADAGRNELRDWLTQTHPENRPHSEPLLRSFFAWTLSPQEARAYFERRAHIARQSIIEYEAIASAFAPSTPEEVASRIALESGIRIARASAEWAEWAAEQYR